MNHFSYKGTRLFAEDVPLSAIADAVGTPTYVYAKATLVRHLRVMNEAFARVPHLLCYSVKASSNLALLSLIDQAGAGFDVVSGGELSRVLRAGGSPSRTVFSGVGKTVGEMEEAHAAGLLLFNVESAEELEALDGVGRRARKPAPFAIRVNPDVDAKTHRHIATGLSSSKFGVPMSQAGLLYARARRMKGLIAKGVDCHIGSQLTKVGPVRAAVEKVADFYVALRAKHPHLAYLDVGGGLGITYRAERPPSPADYAKVVVGALSRTGATLILEPGRVLVGNAAVLLTKVLYRKASPIKQFVVVDAGMNDLIRPALYEAHHEIAPLVRRAGSRQRVDLVGPVCESSDVFAKARPMVLPKPGDFLALMSAGAYGMSMASNYNSRPRAAEVLVDQDRYRVIRERELPEDLWRGETT
jgi:diaminopimelate decarboxylase